MYTIVQVKNGLMEFLNEQVIPHLTGAKRFGAVLYLNLASDALVGQARDLAHNPAVQMLGVMSDDGSMVDVDRIHAAMIQSADSDRIEIDVPLLGVFTFNRHDIDQLYEDIVHQA